MKQYPVLNEQFDQLVHIDAYRIDSEEEIEPLRLREIFKKPRTIICIEWPEQIPSVIPSSAVRIEIVISEGETRIVKVLHENIE
jgi:tRNA threonylcarbamoyladenosine biosynthesis protein TsaE